MTKKGTEGLRFDDGKPRIDLIPPEILFALGEVLRVGDLKYGPKGGPRNWEKGMEWGKVFGSLMRHLWKWWGGEDYDRETKCHHLWLALANVAFLVTYTTRGLGTDTRATTQVPKTGPVQRRGLRSRGLHGHGKQRRIGKRVRGSRLGK